MYMKIDKKDYFQNPQNLLLLFILIYLVIRIAIVNINFTEWGDTFRMIRAADFLSNGLWPWDEKRWPFYSVLLVPGIWLNDPLFWGRFLSFMASAGTLALTYALYLKLNVDFKSTTFYWDQKFSLKNIISFIKAYFKKENAYSVEKYALLSTILLAVSPVFAYWSIRVMADPVFAMLILIYGLVFIKSYQKAEVKNEVLLSLLLLCITMTRLEGLFMFFGTVGFFVLAKKARKLSTILIYLLPQALIYFPFTLYAKVLYSGPVDNDYLKEAQTFVFNLDRFTYFFTYTAFIFVFPPLLYFLIKGILNLKDAVLKSDKSIYLPYLPLALFLLQELLIGFIWTPSLPRIYMPIIPLLVVLTVYGFQTWVPNRKDRWAFLLMVLSICLFGYLQYSYKLYFLGASKILFGIILLSSLVFILIAFALANNPKLKGYLSAFLIFMGALSSAVIIYNQKDIYKSVYQAALFAKTLADQNPQAEKIAYADETGTTSWYLKNNYTYYLSQNDSIEDNQEQYKTLTDNGVTYLITTNEFNRGSQFIDPKVDPRYQLVAVFSVPVYDLIDYTLNYLGLVKIIDSDIFVSKVYRVL